MRQGKVKWYNGKKCYGFVSPDTANEQGDKSDVFIHSSALRAADIRFLNENDIVRFDDEIRNGKLSVTKIELVQRDEESARKFQERRSQYHNDRGDDRGDRRPRHNDRDGDGEKKSGWAFWKK